MSLMGLDIGTTGCKCTIFDIEGRVLSYSYLEYDLENPKPGFYELDPRVVWNSVKHIIHNAINLNSNMEPVTAISISSFGEAAAPVDKQGNVLGNSITYMDQRGAEQCEELVDRLGKQEIMNLAGVSAHPMYTVCKVMWLKEYVPELYNKTWKFMLYGDFILYCLTGVPLIDYSLASRTMAFNVVEKRWEDKVLEAAGLREDIFSEASPSAQIVGNIKKQVAEELGLPKDVLVVTGAHDQVCAVIGGGILKKGLAVDGIGTVECITPTFDKPVLNETMLKYSFNCAPHAKPDMYVTYAFSFTGGSLLKWYRDNFAIYEKMMADKSGKNVYTILDEQAAIEPTDLLVLPHFAGAATPYMDMDTKGAILGLTFGHTSKEVYRALLEGVTYEMALNVECLSKAGIEIDTLRAVGGGAKSDLWLQIKADIMQRKIERLNIDEAGTLGTAIMAGTATGAFSSLEEAAKQLIRVRKEFYPNPKNKERYMENYRRYKKVYESVRKVFH